MQIRCCGRGEGEIKDTACLACEGVKPNLKGNLLWGEIFLRVQLMGPVMNLLKGDGHGSPRSQDVTAPYKISCGAPQEILFLFVFAKQEGHTIDAIPEPGGRWPIFKHMTEVAVTSAAEDLCSFHEEAVVLQGRHAVL